MKGRESLRAVPYVAVRWPESHIVFRLMIDGSTEAMDGYEELRERVTASVREALADLGMHVIEEGEESIEAPSRGSGSASVTIRTGDDRRLTDEVRSRHCTEARPCTDPPDLAHAGGKWWRCKCGAWYVDNGRGVTYVGMTRG